jgi:hypothetical protein
VSKRGDARRARHRREISKRRFARKVAERMLRPYRRREPTDWEVGVRAMRESVDEFGRRITRMSHVLGRSAAEAVKSARAQIAAERKVSAALTRTA